MTNLRIHVVSIVPPAILATALGYYPGYLLAMVIGVLLPEVDAIDPQLHRSWIFHTFLAPAIVYIGLLLSGIAHQFPSTVIALHFVSVGLLFHFLFDFVYPKRMANEGAEWPVRPTIFSDPWGLMWLGISWLVQWFVYLWPSFIPWLAGM